MDKPRSSIADLIAAAVVTSSMGRRNNAAKASDTPVNRTCCPFSLGLFAITLSQSDEARRESGSEETR